MQRITTTYRQSIQIYQFDVHLKIVLLLEANVKHWGTKQRAYGCKMQNQVFVSKSKTFEVLSSCLQFATQLMRTYLVVLPGKDDSCGDGHAGNADATAN